MIRRATFVLSLLVATGVALAQGPVSLPDTGPGELTEAQLARYHALTEELRCVVCQNRNIAESDAPLAQDMRDIVRRQIVAGRSDAEIKDYLVERYGEFVLYRPRFEPATWALWLGPLGLLMMAAGIALWLWRRASARPEPPPPDRGEIERLLTSGKSRGGER